MLRMTWDLPTRHALFWWPLPDARPQTCAAATAICRAIHLRFLSNKQRAGLARAITPYACVRSNGQPMLVIDACLNAGVEADKVGEALQAVVADLADPASRAGRQTITFAGAMAARESPLLANFDAISQQLPAHMKDFAEGVWLLGLMNIEYAWNAPVEEAQPMLTALDEQAVTEILLRLKAEPRGLSLEPKAP
jgi:hypothetical protein